MLLREAGGCLAGQSGMSTQTWVDAGAIVALRGGNKALRLPIEVKCSWQVKHPEDCSSLRALISDDGNERKGVYLPFAQLIGYSVSALSVPAPLNGLNI